MTTDSKRVYWDACVWISMLNRTEGRFDCCEGVIEAARRGEVEVWTSSLSLAEVFKTIRQRTTPAIKQSEEEKDRLFEEFMEQDFVREAQVDHDVGVEARRLLRSHRKLGPNDAIHLATAILWNCDEMHTYDNALLELSGHVTGIDGAKKLVILHPPSPVQANLPLMPPAENQPSDIGEPSQETSSSDMSMPMGAAGATAPVAPATPEAGA